MRQFRNWTNGLRLPLFLWACTLIVLIAAGPSAARTGVDSPARSHETASVATLLQPSASSSVRVPALRGKKLPYAEVLIRRAGLRVGREDCDCTFGVVIKSSWYVCQQWPRAGKLVNRGVRVATYSARDPRDC
jgi:hypothetical protein